MWLFALTSHRSISDIRYFRDTLQPHHLNKREAKNPQSVIYDFFDFANIAQIREMLWLWLSATVIGDFPHGLSRIERDSILTLYEKLEKLIDAAHLLNSPKKIKKKHKN